MSLPKGSKGDPAQHYLHLFTEIGIIAQLSQTWIERLLPAGMSLAQFSVLTHLTRLGGAWSPGRLARAFQITKGAMTNTLQRLENQGFVRVRPDIKDRRAKTVEITDMGRKALERALRAASLEMSLLPDRVPVAAVEAALPFLEHVRKTLDAQRASNPRGGAVKTALGDTETGKF